MNFSINCLEITASKEIVGQNGSIYKNLLSSKDFENTEFCLPKRFFFNDYYKREPDAEGMLVQNTKENRIDTDLFFGKNINIQAIVGMNGCGKSSLLDLIYMAINNFAFMYERGKDRIRAKKLFFIENLFVKLYFSNDAEYRLVCAGECIELQIKYKGRFIPASDSHHQIKASFELSKYDEKDFPKDSDEKLYYLMQDFFYTIATNYSIQSLLPNDYKQNTCEFDANQKKIIFDKNNWIESVFQKNDGYVCPVVLNPKRELYGINMDLEKKLAKYREIALLIWARNNKTRFLDEYELDHVDYNLDAEYILKKLESKSISNVLDDIDKKIYIPAKGISNTDEVDYLSVKNHLMIDSTSPIIVKLVLARLIKKIYSITSCSPFTIYGINGKKSVFNDKGGLNFNLYFAELLNDIEKDKSHVVTKIWQMLHFLQKDWINDYELIEKANNWLEKGFSLSDYEKEICKGSNSLDDIICNLPPSIFKYEVYLKKVSSGEIVNMALLSSGESQMFQTLSTHMYHIRNVLSIKEANKAFYKNKEFEKLRPDYNCMNLIFDEVEICFHPEYQRLFVDKLIKMLVNMKMTEECSFNIFIITHSPFVLSDIPKQNVLYLQEGKQVYTDFETYAQNIGSVLRNGFFLKSFIGENAKNRINLMIDALIENKADEKIPSYNILATSIGDAFLRNEIQSLYKKGI